MRQDTARSKRAVKLREYLNTLLSKKTTLRDVVVKEFNTPIYRVLSTLDNKNTKTRITSAKLCDAYAQCLCAALTKLEKDGEDISFIYSIASESLGTWWDDHKKEDQRRLDALRKELAAKQAEIERLIKELGDEGG